VTLIEVILNLKGEAISLTTETTWGLIFIFLSILWVNCDADWNEFEKPFDFGFIVYVLWPVALPWYLVHTRGVEGLLVYLGFITIWLLPWLAGLVIHAYFT
jgi:hypothetical protein